MKKHIPNIITLVNLFCGCCALICIFNEMYVLAFWFTFAGGWADYADGLVARSLGVNSTLGKELDSLADMVSFGVVPGAIMYTLIANHEMSSDFFYHKINLLGLVGFVITLFSALRLAKFNLDTRQSEDFIGLPTPSVTMFVVGVMLIYHYDSFGLAEWVSHPYFLIGSSLILSYLLIAELPMFSMKFKGMKWKGNERRIIFLVLGVLGLIFLQEAAFAFVIILYVLLSLFEKMVKA